MRTTTACQVRHPELGSACHLPEHDERDLHQARGLNADGSVFTMTWRGGSRHGADPNVLDPQMLYLLSMLCTPEVLAGLDPPAQPRWARQVGALVGRRTELGMTVAEVARRSGLPRAAVQALEDTADPPLSVLYAYAAAVGVGVRLVLEPDGGPGAEGAG